MFRFIYGKSTKAWFIAYIPRWAVCLLRNYEHFWSSIHNLFISISKIGIDTIRISRGKGYVIPCRYFNISVFIHTTRIHNCFDIGDFG